MTIAISIKVNDGVVLAADSASTLIGQQPGGATSIINIYNNADKVFNLRKGLPIGTITWGSGSIGTASISTLMKDLRKRFSGKAQEYIDWQINETNYNVLDIANRFRAFMFDECYIPAFRDWPNKPLLGFIVAGYSAGVGMAEEYQMDIINGECNGPRPVRPNNECGITWSGEPEAINRLVLGFGTQLPRVLEHRLAVPPEQIAPAIEIIKQELSAPLITAPMPIQDAIDLAEFLVSLTTKFSRFTPGGPTVGGPIEIAAITKHEGFKWVKRKYYFDRNLNPEENHD